MNKITIEYETPCKNEIVKMKDMPLGSIGEIIEDGIYKGIIVRRAICTLPFLVEDLSKPGKDKCWSNPNTTMVKLLPDAEIKVII
jgi:hypothetical protein